MTTLKYNGTEATQVRAVKGQPKISVEPGETFEAVGSQVETLLNHGGRFVLVGTEGESKTDKPKPAAAKKDDKPKSETKKEKAAREAKEAEDVKAFDAFKEMVDSRTPEQFDKLVANLDKAIATLPEAYQEQGRVYVQSKVEADAETEETGEETGEGSEENDAEDGQGDEEDSESEEGAEGEKESA